MWSNKWKFCDFENCSLTLSLAQKSFLTITSYYEWTYTSYTQTHTIRTYTQPRADLSFEALGLGRLVPHARRACSVSKSRLNCSLSAPSSLPKMRPNRLALVVGVSRLEATQHTTYSASHTRTDVLPKKNVSLTLFWTKALNPRPTLPSSTHIRRTHTHMNQVRSHARHPLGTSLNMYVHFRQIQTHTHIYTHFFMSTSYTLFASLCPCVELVRLLFLLSIENPKAKRVRKFCVYFTQTHILEHTDWLVKYELNICYAAFTSWYGLANKPKESIRKNYFDVTVQTYTRREKERERERVSLGSNFCSSFSSCLLCVRFDREIWTDYLWCAHTHTLMYDKTTILTDIQPTIFQREHVDDENRRLNVCLLESLYNVYVQTYNTRYAYIEQCTCKTHAYRTESEYHTHTLLLGREVLDLRVAWLGSCHQIVRAHERES